ncbi:MAG: lysylphosphatidylglycerol synthase transmembrane domain-containing protein [Bacteroidota bacterium]
MTILKIGISTALIYFIFTKINFKDIVSVIKGATPIYLLSAVLLFVLSKIANALRLNLYFHQIGVRLTELSNLKLYILGMFYNLFLPGGIGGDAYKGYVIQRKYRSGTKKVVSVLLLDRLSGMLFIFIYSCLFAIFLKYTFFSNILWLFIIAIPLSVLFFWVLNKKFFSYTLPIFWKSLTYSAFVQLVQLVAVFLILQALGITTNLMAYLFVFLVSSIVSVLPLTIGGIGSREVTFLYGAKWLALDMGTSVGVSMVFFLITALVSLTGIIYHFKKPELQVVEH